jgi:hypothetical protein
MDASLVVYRALGVPDAVVDPDHRREAAAWHLGKLASVSLASTDPARANHHVEALAAIIDVVVEHVGTGRLDEVLGNYGFVRATSYWADQVLLTSKIEANPDDVRHWSAVLLNCLVEFVTTHPFDAMPVQPSAPPLPRGRRRSGP